MPEWRKVIKSVYSTQRNDSSDGKKYEEQAKTRKKEFALN